MWLSFLGGKRITLKNPTFTFADTELPFHPPRECLIEFSAFNTQMPAEQIDDHTIRIDTPLMFTPPKFMWGWTFKRINLEND